MTLRLKAANDDASPLSEAGSGSRLLDWLARLTQPGFSLDLLNDPIAGFPLAEKRQDKTPHADDWHSVSHICGYNRGEFLAAGAELPLTAAEIEYFRRNHRGTENHISRDFLTAQTDLPSPLAELYGLYRHRARIDAEATLWIAQSTHSMRVARVMADLLAIGAFANGHEYVGHMGVTYSVPCAFDTATIIDRANKEAARRLALPADHPSHLLKLTPDELGVLAASIAEKSALSAEAFTKKANLLAEARQDVNRLTTDRHFTTVIAEHDLPVQEEWTERLISAFARILPGWVSELPEAQPMIH